MKAKILALIAVVLLSGCSGMHGTRAPAINANGAIKWANGINEDMHISPSGGTLTFATPSTTFAPSGIAIFTRIDSARNNDCEHYYSEIEMKTRLEICSNGEVTLFQTGKVINVGVLARYTY